MKGTPVTDEVIDYMNELFPSEDELLRRLRVDAEAAGIPPIAISSEQGAFLRVLLKGIGAKRVIEVGTLAGYSAISMARALPEDGELVTLEVNPLHAQFATAQLERAGLAGRARVLTGSALDLLERELAGSGPYDFAFIDADKPSYRRYLELLVPMMRRGGMIAGDNALAWGRIADRDPDDASVRGMQEFNRAVADDPRLEGCLVPIGDGVCLAVVV